MVQVLKASMLVKHSCVRFSIIRFYHGQISGDTTSLYTLLTESESNYKWSLLLVELDHIQLWLV